MSEPWRPAQASERSNQVGAFGSVFARLWRIRGRDKAPVPRQSEAATRLMPDSHTGVGNSHNHVRLALDRCPQEPVCVSVGAGKVFLDRTEPFSARRYLTLRGQDRRRVLLGRCSTQDEIDQRENGSPDSGSYQCVVDTEVRACLDRRWPGFLGHFRDLDQVGRAFCEAGYIR
jgi:hypothetical protein